MKKSFALLLGLAVLASCSNDDFENNKNQNDELVPIELGAGVNVITRAPITSSSTNVIAGIAGWEKEGDGDPNYSEAPTWGNTDDKVNITIQGDGSKVTWNDNKQKYYDPSETVTTYMKAWYPVGTITNSQVTFSNTNGDMDVLLAPVVSGNKANKTESKTLKFQHMTSQIIFKVKRGTGLASETKIKSIAISNAQLPIGFDLSKDINTDGAVTYAQPTSFKIPGIDNTQEILDDAVTAGVPVMIKPMGTNTFDIEVETDKNNYGAQTVNITKGGPMAAGTAYEIELTFGQSGIELNATIANWEKGEGSAEIQ